MIYKRHTLSFKIETEKRIHTGFGWSSDDEQEELLKLQSAALSAELGQAEHMADISWVPTKEHEKEAEQQEKNHIKKHATNSCSFRGGKQ